MSSCMRYWTVSRRDIFFPSCSDQSFQQADGKPFGDGLGGNDSRGELEVIARQHQPVDTLKRCPGGSFRALAGLVQDAPVKMLAA